jgi:hypothetical protein
MIPLYGAWCVFFKKDSNKISRGSDEMFLDFCRSNVKFFGHCIEYFFQ